MPDGRAARGASARRPSLKRQLLVMFLCVIIPVSVLLSLLLVSAADYSRSRLAHTCFIPRGERRAAMASAAPVSRPERAGVLLGVEL